jgi:hypothetical protein
MKSSWGFIEVWVDLNFQPGHVEWVDNGGIVLSLQDWINIMIHIRGSDSELEPHLRETHLDW